VAARRGRSVAPDDGIDVGGLAGRCTNDRGAAAGLDDAVVRQPVRRIGGRCREQRRERQQQTGVDEQARQPQRLRVRRRGPQALGQRGFEAHGVDDVRGMARVLHTVTPSTAAAPGAHGPRLVRCNAGANRKTP
jgi:hypothetical protein